MNREELEERQLEIANRMKNIIWTVCGDYTLEAKPDVEAFLKSKYIALYDGIKQGAFAKYFEKEKLSMYLVKKVYLGAREDALVAIAQLCMEKAVGDRIARERKGVSSIQKKVGGPVYYIKYVFKGRFGKFLAGFFSVAIILALGFMGNMVQSNSIGAAFNNAFHVPKLAVGICVAVIAGIIFIGGIKRIASFTEKIVPIMALLYIIGCLVILVMHLPGVGTAFKDIFVGAFAPQAIAGGALGVTVQKAMRFGVARGLFSNEAGMGSTPHAHATAEVKDPCDQGIIAMMGVFIDTFIILTLTALVILSTGVLGNGQTGSELAQSAFNVGFGNFGNIFIALCMLFFAFTTIVGWYYFGEVNVRHLFGNGAVKVYAVIVVICVIIGSTLKVDLVWDMADMFNGLMVLPNLIALLGCLAIVRKLTKKSENSKEK